MSNGYETTIARWMPFASAVLGAVCLACMAATSLSAQTPTPRPVHVAPECYDPTTGLLPAPPSGVIDATSGTARFCVPWHDIDPGNETAYPAGELADCTVTFFDGTSLDVPQVPVGSIQSYQPPKDGVAPVSASCVVRGLASPLASRDAQHPPFLGPAAVLLLD